MGCDIHPYIDFEVEHTPPGSKPYISVRNYAELYGNRDYLLFGLLTGGQVRVPDAYIPEVGTPLGLPGRVSWKTLDEAALYIVPDDQEREEEGMAFESDALRWVNSGYSNWINYDFRESTINYTIPAQREGVATIPKNAPVSPIRIGTVTPTSIPIS